MKIDIWSDVSCPWCYITKRTFERALAASGRTDARIEFHPYQIDGEHPAEPTPMLRWLAGKYGEDRAQRMSDEVTAAGPRHGIAFRNATGFAVNTLQAHRLLRLAGREYGRTVQSRLEELIFAAYFTDNGNVADPGLLTDRAERAGMDPGRAAAFLASDEDLDGTRAEILAARAVHGVSTVPLFLFDGEHRVEGAQEDPQVFLRALTGDLTRTAPDLKEFS